MSIKLCLLPSGFEKRRVILQLQFGRRVVKLMPEPSGKNRMSPQRHIKVETMPELVDKEEEEKNSKAITNGPKLRHRVVHGMGNGFVH